MKCEDCKYAEWVRDSFYDEKYFPGMMAPWEIECKLGGNPETCENDGGEE